MKIRVIAVLTLVVLCTSFLLYWGIENNFWRSESVLSGSAIKADDSSASLSAFNQSAQSFPATSELPFVPQPGPPLTGCSDEDMVTAIADAMFIAVTDLHATEEPAKDEALLYDFQRFILIGGNWNEPYFLYSQQRATDQFGTDYYPREFVQTAAYEVLGIENFDIKKNAATKTYYQEKNAWVFLEGGYSYSYQTGDKQMTIDGDSFVMEYRNIVKNDYGDGGWGESEGIDYGDCAFHFQKMTYEDGTPYFRLVKITQTRVP